MWWVGHILWHIFWFICFIESLSVSTVGAAAYHDSLRGDQTTGLFDFGKDVSPCLRVSLFSVARPLSWGGHRLA